MPKYRKKPIEVDAVKWDGSEEAWQEILKLAALSVSDVARTMRDVLLIFTLEGEMRGEKGCYVILGHHRELYPCKGDIFEETYEAVPAELKWNWALGGDKPNDGRDWG